MKQPGYSILILLFLIAVLGIGLLAAVPVWQTQIQREREMELIFRGQQYVEAVRKFTVKNPGEFPESFEELLEERCLRKPFPDPMTPDGEWLVILLPATPAAKKGAPAQKVLIAPAFALKSISRPRIIGVVSRSTQTSIKIHNNQESYDKWLFFYGQDPERLPEITYYGEDQR